MKKGLVLLLAAFLCLSLCNVWAEELLGGKEAWKIEGESNADSIRQAIDGDINTYWHSAYVAENRVIVSRDEPPYYLTITLPETKSLSGLCYTPRQDMANGRIIEYNIYLGDSADQAYLVKNGNFDPQSKAMQKAYFDKAYRARVIVLELVSTTGYGCIGELDLMAGAGSGDTPAGTLLDTTKLTDPTKYMGGVTVVPQSLWTATASSFRQGNGTEKMLDGNKNSYWHSNYTNEGSTITGSDPSPYEIEFHIEESTPVCGIIFTPRQDTPSGRPTLYSVYASSSEADDYMPLVVQAEGSKAADDIMTTFFANVRVKKLKLVLDETWGNYGMCAELNFMAEDRHLPTIDAKDYEQYRLYELSGVMVTCTGESVKEVTDGNTATTVSKSGKPVVFTAELPQEAEVAAISFYPLRIFSYSGLWTNFDVKVSTDGKTFQPVMTGESFEKMLKKQYALFQQPVRAKYVQICVNEGVGGSVSAAEIGICQSGSDYHAAVAAGREYYELTIGSNDIFVRHGSGEKTITSDVAPFIKSDITFIPLRVLLEEMGAEVTWDGDKQEITIRKTGKEGPVTIRMNIMDDRVYVTNSDPTTYDVIRYTLIAPPRIYESRTFIPLRFVSEHLGYQVAWDGQERKITVSKE